MRCTSCTQKINSILAAFCISNPSSCYLKAFSVSFALSKVFLEIISSDAISSISLYLEKSIFPYLEEAGFPCFLIDIFEDFDLNVSVPGKHTYDVLVIAKHLPDTALSDEIALLSSEESVFSSILPGIVFKRPFLKRNDNAVSFCASAATNISALAFLLPENSTIIKVPDHGQSKPPKDTNYLIGDLMLSSGVLVFQIIFSFFPFSTVLQLLLIILLLAFSTYLKLVLELGIKGLVCGQPTMDSLVSLAFIGSLLLEMINFDRLDPFLSFTMLLISVLAGRILETQIDQKRTHLSTNNDVLARLLRPVNEMFKEIFVSPDLLSPGDLVRILPGETVPTDGKLVLGACSYFDESFITGESAPVYRESRVIGDHNGQLMGSNYSDILLAGTTNVITGRPVITECSCSTNKSISSCLARITETALSKHSNAQRFADGLARWFVPLVLVLSGLTFFLNVIMSSNVTSAIERSISVMVSACPCAMALAAPIIFSAAIKIARGWGVIFNDISSFESLSTIQHIFFDKTGTITTGALALKGLFLYPENRQDSYRILAIIKRLAMTSSHPICSSLSHHLQLLGETSMEELAIDDVHEIPGRGISCLVCAGGANESTKALLGNRTFLEGNGVGVPQTCDDSTMVLFALDGIHVATITFSESVREEAPSVINELSKIMRVSLLTGDRKGAAQAAAAVIGLESDIFYECDPFAKEKIIKDATKGNQNIPSLSVAMVGDGLNDSAAMANATLSIAVGAGSTSILWNSKMVIMRSNHPLSMIPETVHLCRKAKMWTYGLWTISLIYNGVMLPMEMGLIKNIFVPSYIASFFMSLSSVGVLVSGHLFSFFNSSGRGKPLKKSFSITT